MAPGNRKNHAFPSEERGVFLNRNYLCPALIVLALSLAGCANTKFTDDDYRPLGNPQADNRAS